LITKIDGHIEAKKLIVASTTTVCGNVPDRAITFLKETFLGNNKPQKPSRKLYISRITNRKVINEEEIFSYLKKL